jgi:hypothetical protein
MRPPLFIGFVFALALAAPAALAQTPTSNPPAAADNGAKQVVAKDPDEIVCVRQPAMDSRIPGPKECHTRRVWDQMSEDARRNTQDYQNRSNQGATMRGG